MKLLPILICSTLITKTIAKWEYTPDILTLYLTNPQYPSPVLITPENISAIDAQLKIVIYSHGWMGDWKSNVVTELRAALPNATNFITVNWDKYAHQFYTSSAHDVCIVGQHLGEFIVALHESCYDMQSVHLIGHSLGAHLTGTAARFAHRKMHTKVARVTGLDPAGPLFYKIFNINLSCALRRSDALFVDTLHTNAGMFGTLENLGDANFYANCGILQPACPDIDIKKLSVKELLKILDTISCSHSRSLYLYIESIKTNNFPAVHSPIPYLICKEFNGRGAIHFGYYVPNTSKGNFYFRTHAHSPYAMGMEGCCGLKCIL